MKRKRMLAVALALVVALTAAVSAAASTLYVGDTKEYSIAFKAEGTQLYIVEFAGPTDCYFTEPLEDAGQSGFNVFAAPKLMRRERDGFYAETYFGEHARVRAELGNEEVSGDYSFEEGEEGFHCDTGSSPKPFQAVRYLPTGGGPIPTRTERPVYYGSEDQIEIFLRADAEEAYGIRGTFVPSCRVHHSKAIPNRHAFFPKPAAAKVGEDGGFEQEAEESGRTRSGARYKEKLSLTGTVAEGTVTGTYFRVRTVKPRRKAARRCVTGPIAFSAARYLPVG
jgi:hypothetical protein